VIVVSEALVSYVKDWAQAVLVAFSLGIFLFLLLLNGGYDFGTPNGGMSLVLLSLFIGLVGMYLAIRKIPN